MYDTQHIIAANLNKLMKHFDLKQLALAQSAGVAQHTISNILNPKAGVPVVSLDILMKLAKFFNIPVYYFFLDNMDVNLMLDGSVDTLIQDYVRLSDRGKKVVLLAVKTGSSYRTDTLRMMLGFLEFNELI